MITSAICYACAVAPSDVHSSGGAPLCRACFAALDVPAIPVQRAISRDRDEATPVDDHGVVRMAKLERIADAAAALDAVLATAEGCNATTYWFTYSSEAVVEFKSALGCLGVGAAKPGEVRA